MRAARRLTLSLLVAVSTAAALVGPVLTAAASTGPTVAITAPATATGLVTVTATGNVDPTENDTVTTMTLLVNGVPYGASQACRTNGIDQCATTFTWDSTGLNGPYTLSARLMTSKHPATDSAPVTVTATNPAPTVTISAPKPGAVAHGTLSVTATGSLDLSQSDTSVSLQLWVDGLKYGLPVACPLTVDVAKTCTTTFTVHASTWSGAHTVQVSVATALNSASSPVVPWFAFTATKVALSPVATVHAGKLAVIRGKAVAVNSGGPLVGARVAVTLTPAIGKKHTLVVHTGATGRFSLATKVAVNTTISAVVTATADVGTSRAAAKAGVLAPIVCKADKTVGHGHFGAGTCTATHLPDRTKVTLQYESNKKWHLLVAGTTAGTTIPISFQFSKPGSYPMRLVLGANKAYVVTYGTPFVVRVT
ncbi:MAG: hypothetical protein QOE24_1912 [Frankiales bacterium]|nr:hypothetical protein [Frankiales bacterium]